MSSECEHVQLYGPCRIPYFANNLGSLKRADRPCIVDLGRDALSRPMACHVEVK